MQSEQEILRARQVDIFREWARYLEVELGWRRDKVLKVVAGQWGWCKRRSGGRADRAAVEDFDRLAARAFSRCRSCGRAIVWGQSLHGLPMPYDVGVEGDGGRRPHWASCPEAAEWRRGGEGQVSLF